MNDYPSVYDAIISIDTSGVSGSSSIAVSGLVVVSPSSTLPHGYGSDIVTAASGVTSYTYVIESLQTGVPYYVAVSAINADGFSVAQQSLPQQLSPPEQKASNPIEVYMVSQSSSALSVLWMAGESSGGAAVSKYKIEWDFNSTFDSNAGSPVGSHHKVISSGQNCSAFHCSYMISGLQKGIPYYTRVFSYNAFGYSQDAGIPVGLFESPKSQPTAPSSVSLQSVSPDSIMVTIAPVTDNGGAPVTFYNIEWDVLDSAAYDSSTNPALSLLYSRHSVQAISTSAAAYGLSGYFYVQFGGIMSGKIMVDATAEDVTVALEAIPTCGQVLVTRKEMQDTFGYRWSVTFLNSEWYSDGVRYFDMPLLSLANVPGTQVKDFSSSILSVTSGSTFTGLSGRVSVSQLVVPMSGYEQLSIDITVSSGLISGTFALTTGQSSTPQLPVNASFSAIRTALLLVSGECVVRRSNMLSGSGFTLFIIFTQTLGNNAILTADTSFITSTD